MGLILFTVEKFDVWVCDVDGIAISDSISFKVFWRVPSSI